MFLHDIGWCMNDLLIMKPTVARSFGEAVDCELCFSIWVYSVCADLYLCAIFPEGKIPALPLPEFTQGALYCFQYRSCRMAVHISDTQSTLCMEIRQQNVDLKKQKQKTINFLVFSSETRTVFAMPARDTTYIKHYSRPWIWKIDGVKFTLGCK